MSNYGIPAKKENADKGEKKTIPAQRKLPINMMLKTNIKMKLTI